MEKYLRLYAEPETAALDALPEHFVWSHVVVIPACNESAGFLRPPPPATARSLMVLVINESLSAARRVSSCNQALADVLFARFELLWQSVPEQEDFILSLLRDAEHLRDILLVDRFSEGRQLPDKGGVGLARKIGADLATSLIHRKRIHCPWIHCTDADVTLPETYFRCSDNVRDLQQDHAALLYPFCHCDGSGEVNNEEVGLATQLYEFSLRYYVAGMRFAGSPYAFHTIGSTMAVNADHYARVRGFPKREAGEDFYLLNKLAKVGQVLELKQEEGCLPIKIEPRCSDRVPFGTGAAVSRITQMGNPLEDYHFYDPAVFVWLGQWLSSIPVIWQSGSAELTAGIFPCTDAENRNGLPHGLLEALASIKTGQALEHAFRQSSDLVQFTRQMNTWFDAFRTLKLIHYLRDAHLPSVTYTRLQADHAFQKLLNEDSELSNFHEQLQRKLPRYRLSH